MLPTICYVSWPIKHGEIAMMMKKFIEVWKEKAPHWQGHALVRKGCLVKKILGGLNMNIVIYILFLQCLVILNNN